MVISCTLHLGSLLTFISPFLHARIFFKSKIAFERHPSFSSHQLPRKTQNHWIRKTWLKEGNSPTLLVLVCHCVSAIVCDCDCVMCLSLDVHFSAFTIGAGKLEQDLQSAGVGVPMAGVSCLNLLALSAVAENQHTYLHLQNWDIWFPSFCLLLPQIHNKCVLIR